MDEITPIDPAGTWIEVQPWPGHPVTQILPVDNAGTWIEVTPAQPPSWNVGGFIADTAGWSTAIIHG